MNLRPCPECGADIAYHAKSCACGWGARKHNPEAPKDYGCAAYGCPLPGSISASIGPHGTYYCRHHFGEPLKDFDAITVRIKLGHADTADAKARADYRAMIREKFERDGMRQEPGNLGAPKTEARAAAVLAESMEGEM